MHLRLPGYAWTAPVIPGLVAAWIWTRPDLLLVEHVVFEGPVRATPAELRHVLDLSNGTPIWAVDDEALARAVERHPWVRDAEVVVEWPATVRVRVDEHVPVALLHDGDRLVYVDAEGEPFLGASSILSGGLRAEDLDLPHLTGFLPELRQLHPALLPLALDDALRLVDALDTRGLVPRDRVSEVAFRRTSGFRVVAGRAELVFGLADLDQQVDRLALLVQQGLDLEAPTHVDLAPASVALVRQL